jgi:hypothetical protein
VRRSSLHSDGINVIISTTKAAKACNILSVVNAILTILETFPVLKPCL